MLRTIFFVSCSALIVLSDDGVGLFPDIPAGVLDTDNVLCSDHFEQYANHLRNLSLWAHEMRDATAKSVTGILRGSISQFGQFEECLTAKAPFPTQYCLATIIANVPRPIPERNPKSLIYEPNESVLRKIYDKKDPSQQPENVVLMGWCVPASCSPANLQNSLNKYFEEMDFPLKNENVTYSSVVDASSCQKEDEYKEFDQADISFGLVSSIIVSIVILSTVYDFFRDTTSEKLKERSPTVELLIAFSLRKNYRKLPSANDSNPALKILYGMRVICICMIIMDHRFGTHLASGILNFDIVEDQYRSPVGTIFFHGDVFVDSFFILSGILVTYTLMIQYDKRFMNPAVIIFMRYVRLTPLYAMVIFYYATMFRYTGAGPMWKKIIVPEVEDCRANWWTNLLYISNYVNVDHMCMVHSWYLPCDFHYFIIAIVLCIVIHKSKKIGLFFLGFVTFLTVLAPFLVVYLLELSAVIYFYPDFLRLPKQQVDFILAYSKSHTRASPYFIGMIAGYLYYRMRGSGKRLKVTYSHLILFVSLGIMVGSIVTGVIFYDPAYQYNPLESALYASMHRVVWAVGSVGVLYVASFGHAKFIYRFLSWRPWVPLSKLVYGAYLVHMQFQLRAVARKGGADVSTYFDGISQALSDIILAFGTALILYLFVEAPFRNIFSLLLAHPRSNKHSKQKSESPENVSESTCDSHL
ncbi:unnamed protein product [Phaedon cochleariae]|uniref:Nose resistant-to-fluoxetine protein N-terminal domain-containing protein n=1 Tax=Phaedon cochleariae TaxID=80249 RepID=A0A9N9SI49_PHACE|nr:unnamed protein product [Phaedon cochleariae]